MHPFEFWELTLSEFDRKCRGYHQRELEAYRRTRLVVAELRNAFRGPQDPWQTPEQVMSLPGDGARLALPEPEEDIDALWAELDQRDAALLTPKNG